MDAHDLHRYCDHHFFSVGTGGARPGTAQQQGLVFPGAAGECFPDRYHVWHQSSLVQLAQRFIAVPLIQSATTST